ncbi:MAG: methionine biosynthesis protein MetW [Alphaproteobacteria bacterium]
MDAHSNKPRKAARVDHLLIAEMVTSGARVLDIGCGDGELLTLLESDNGVDGRGIELQRSRVNSCVERGLSVIQGDADTDLKHFPVGSFDYAILSRTLQATRNPRHVLEQLLRIAKYAIVSFPNYGHWRIRLNLLFSGTMPVTPNLPEPWYESENIHPCTIKDFQTLCKEVNAKVERSVALNVYGERMGLSLPWPCQNVFGEQAVFLLTRDDSANGS